MPRILRPYPQDELSGDPVDTPPAVASVVREADVRPYVLAVLGERGEVVERRCHSSWPWLIRMAYSATTDVTAPRLSVSDLKDRDELTASTSGLATGPIGGLLTSPRAEPLGRGELLDEAAPGAGALRPRETSEVECSHPAAVSFLGAGRTAVLVVVPGSEWPSDDLPIADEAVAPVELDHEAREVRRRISSPSSVSLALGLGLAGDGAVAPWTFARGATEEGDLAPGADEFSLRTGLVAALVVLFAEASGEVAPAASWFGAEPLGHRCCSTWEV